MSRSEQDGPWNLTAISPNTMRETGRLEIPESQLPQQSISVFQLSCGDQSFVIAAEKQLIVGSLDRFRTEPLPFHIIPEQNEFFLKRNETTRLKFRADGAIRYELNSALISGEWPPLSLKSENGEFDVRISEPDIEAVRQAAFWVSLDDRDTDTSFPERLRRYMPPLDEWYQQVFGRSVGDRFPVMIPMIVSAENAQGESSHLIFNMILEISQGEVLDAFRETPVPIDP